MGCEGRGAGSKGCEGTGAAEVLGATDVRVQGQGV